MNIRNQKASSIIKDVIVATLPKIEVKGGLCRYNFRCQMNAVHDALTDGQDKIAMCFYLDEDEPIIHFLNVDKKGNYIDNTLGKWAQTHEYYLIRLIEKESFFEVNKIFTAYRKEIKTKMPFYVRWFSKCEF